jgi:hypothetical protein
MRTTNEWGQEVKLLLIVDLSNGWGGPVTAMQATMGREGIAPTHC